MRTILFACAIIISMQLRAQVKDRDISFACTNNHAAYPFSSFKSLFHKEFHPGFEAGYHFTWHNKSKHDWYQSFKTGYFFHRFVQHAIPVYTQFGYRYKLKKHFRITTSLGAGYLHSIPATAVLRLNNTGEYKNAKGIGRGQAILNFTIGFHYVVNPDHQMPVSLFASYQQQLQMPFIRSYVPLLPYNSIALGISLPLKL